MADEVRARLERLSRSGKFLFGQQNASLWGMYLDGRIVPTSDWFERTARAGRWTSDGAQIAGADAAVLGVGIDMFAFDPPQWKRSDLVAEAMRRHLDRGGLVTLDWHPPSCAAPYAPVAQLGEVNVDGQEVTIHTSGGGTLFYAEEGYKQSIARPGDVPESLSCLCKIANDQSIDSGPYRGISGKTWLVALAKHTARVVRAQGLAGRPLVIRPFHEQNGAWFWWGRPYWSCDKLLGKPDAISGPEAYKQVVRTYVSTLRAEPGMEGALFAYSPGKLALPKERERLKPLEQKLQDPAALARDLLRDRLVAELGALGLVYTSPAERRVTLSMAEVRTIADERRYVAERRRIYRESYPGDDVIDLLGIDLYFPRARAANAADRREIGLQLRTLGEEAQAHRKPHALTETGTFRLQLMYLLRQQPPGAPLRISSKAEVEGAHALLFSPEDRRQFLSELGLDAPADVRLAEDEIATLFPNAGAYVEDWYNTQLLGLAKAAKVAYALVWQTYFGGSQAAPDTYPYYYVPFPGHPEAEGFLRFAHDPAVCLLDDGCGAQAARASQRSNASKE